MRIASAGLPRFLLMTSTALLAPASIAMAQDAAPQAAPQPADGGNVIIVTAQKRSENLQNVPISIQALGTQKLDQLNVSNFNGYTQQLPTVVAQSSGTPGTNIIYMRGVASGGDGNHSGPLPSVGVYLDEQPVTTIGGNLDVHVYDIARIESLAGPQGTLYGASSEAGTIRIITNKPDTSGFYGRMDVEANQVHKGGTGGKVEGMINIPLSPKAALRVVGYYEKDAGYIDNVAGTRSFLPEGTGITINNSQYVKKNYNDTEIAGGRALLKVDLDDNWTVTPGIMYQDTRSHGNYGYDSSVGDLQVQHFLPEYRRDIFAQASLTIEGKIGSWDLTYAGAYLDRKTFSSSDYTDYAEAYDSLYSGAGGLAGYFYYKDNAGNQIKPIQQVFGQDHFKKMSHELRIASPTGEKARFVGGLFYQRQSNLIHQDYQVAGLADLLSVNGKPGTLWLTQQNRVDKDYAAFGEVSYDFTPTITATAGGRYFKYDNSLIGFFGFGRNPAFYQGADGNPPPNAAGSTRTGVAGCYTTDGLTLRNAQLAGETNITLLPAAVGGSPCTNLGDYVNGGVVPKRAKGDGGTYRFNLTWKPESNVTAYITVSRGFRPGGINRRADVDPYKPDYLTNFEAGLKTTLFDGLLRLNTAVYLQNWKNFQFAYLGANSFTEIHNGPDARIRGVEFDANVVKGGFSFNLGGAYTDARTTKNLCAVDDLTYSCSGSGNYVAAPANTRLPITPKWKLASTLRYSVPVGAAKVYGQVNATYQSSASSDLRTAAIQPGTGELINPAELLGRIAAFTQVNFALGSEWDKYSLELFATNAFDERGQLSRYVACGVCYNRVYIVPNQPRTLGIRAGAKF
ncbi:TonB-dependent receptor [Novosphingobium pokkalii]|uniref:TonB-dependent receptor n=1 Tax=Novosphingobium pokkalii TaxID=1770194 RepID=A0ABV7V8R6_9SPHN|nr:TonB-dependent receptor [Novosphingobium pokkalii]GHC95184.1 TonB-dependent receptor [Novosphingobium pokkalii]